MFNIIQKLNNKLRKSLFGTLSYQSSQYQSADFWHDYYLAGEPSAPTGKLAALAQHRNPIIRQRVAENPYIPGYVQRLLVNDKDTNVRVTLTTNPSVLIEIWKQLAEDKSELVRFSLARNKNMPVPMLLNLARDKQTNVAGQAKQTIEEIFGAVRAFAA